MQENLQNKSEEYIKKNRRKSVWKRVVQILACVVVFCTTYALILPAITMEQKTFCGQEEHVHTQKCYREIPVASELICPLIEGEIVETELSSVSDSDATVETITPHVHTEDCYGVPEVAPLTCGLEENEEHSHDFLCYGKWELVCEKAEHTHSLACFSDSEADVESEAVWENMVLNLDLTGYRVEDVVTIAKSQLGYTESARNYRVNEDMSINGYTRYGAWAQDPYGDWDAMFASFCLHYAEVEGMPVGADAGSWVQELLKVSLYRVTSVHEAQVGNLVFVDEDSDGEADRVAIVSEVLAATEESVAQICTIQGDVANQVQYVSYEMGDGRILGYGIIPKQPDPVRTYSYVDDMLEVDVELPEGTRVPKNALLKVTAIEENSEKYAELLTQAEATVSDTVVKAQFYDISFYTANQEYIPVSDRAQVVMRFKDKVVDPTADTVVLHYGENDTTPVILDKVNVDEQTSYAVEQPATQNSIITNLQVSLTEQTNTVVTFATDGFSVFAVVEVESGRTVTEVVNEYSNFVQQLGDGKTYMIMYSEWVYSEYNRIALRAEMSTVYDNNNNGVPYERLAGQQVQYQPPSENNTIATISNGPAEVLWNFEPIDNTNAFSIYSMSANKYLSMNQEGELELSDNPYGFVSDTVSVNGKNVIRIKGQDGPYIAYFGQNDGYNNVSFSTTQSADDYSHNGLILAENKSAELYSGELITNLGGKIVMIAAVNNDVNGEYGDNQPIPLLSTDLKSDQDVLIGIDCYNYTIENNTIVLNENDVDNKLAWEFEATDTPGTYYIRSATIYEPVNNNAGLYLNTTDDGRLILGQQPQAFEVVRGQVNNQGDVQDVVCLRTQVNGVLNYIELGSNLPGWAFFAASHFENGLNDRNDISYRGNHFVLVEMDDPIVDRINELLDHLPLTEDEYIAMTEPEGSSFEDQVRARKEMRQYAIELMNTYDKDELTSLQIRHIGFWRMEKWNALESELDWLWKENPNIVENDINIDATIKMFNYDASVNNNFLATRENDKFTFYDYTTDETKTANGMGNNAGEYTIPNMASTLQDGYPYVNASNGSPEGGGSLKYLFDDTSKYHVGTMTDGGGLFQYDEEKGYYYYFSDINAAWYNSDPNVNRFELYDVAVYPEFTREKYSKEEWGVPETHGNFYPFNHVITEEEDGSNVIYDGETIGSQLDEYQKISTETAFLNEKVDLWFGMSIEYDFFIPEGRMVKTQNGELQDMIFEFHGDDDVFVYIDDVLVLNLGGTHTAVDGKINFTTGDITWKQTVVTEETDQNGQTTPKKTYVDGPPTNLANLFNKPGVNTGISGNTLSDYTMHNLKFYYLERGGTYSYAGIKFNMPALPEDALLVRKELTTDEQYIDAGLDYQFKIVQADGTTVSNDSFFKEETSFELRGTGTTDEDKGQVAADGSFTLKAGQVAVFNNAKLSAVDPNKGFVVQEILPNWTKDQYDVKYDTNVSDTIPLVSPPSGDTTHGVIGDNSENGYTTYQTDVYSVDKDADNYVQIVTVYNDISNKDLDTLTLTKRAGGDLYIDPNRQFEMLVQVGKDENSLILLPAGTEYELTGGPNGVEEGTVGEDGIIKLRVNETATIKGFLAGTYWKVEEVLASHDNYMPVYSVSVDGGSESAGNTGYFDVNHKQVDFTVTNYQCKVWVNIPIEKNTIGNNSNPTFYFEIQQGDWNENQQLWTPGEFKKEANITINSQTQTTNINFAILGSGDNNTTTTTYFKLSERRSDSQFIYDETFYIIEVNVHNNGGGDGYTTLGRIWKNGDELLEENTQLPFVNYRSTTVTIDKSIPGYKGTFPFVAQVLLNGNTFTDIPDGEGYTVDNDGTIHFDLGDEDSVTIPVPINATVTVTENGNEGYITSYQIGEGASISAASATVQNITSPTAIHFTNQAAYELPATGGSGTHGFIWCGLLMILAAGGLLFNKGRAKRHN